MSRLGGCHRLVLVSLLGLLAGSASCFAQWCGEPDPAATATENVGAAPNSDPSDSRSLITSAPRPAPRRLADDDTRVSSFEAAALSRGTPDIPGLNIVWLVPWINPTLARDWRNIVVHQSESPPGSAWRNAVAQMQKPDRRGAAIWVETDGTVIWAVAEFTVPGHTRSNRNNSLYIDNSKTFGQVNNDNSIGIEFVGNSPNVRRKPTDAQIRAWRILVRVLEVRYAIPPERVFAHNWVSYKDRRYCEGCELADIAREPPEKPTVLIAETHR